MLFFKIGITVKVKDVFYQICNWGLLIHLAYKEVLLWIVWKLYLYLYTTQANIFRKEYTLFNIMLTEFFNQIIYVPVTKNLGMDVVNYDKYLDYLSLSQKLERLFNVQVCDWVYLSPPLLILHVLTFCIHMYFASLTLYSRAQ